MEDTQIFQSTSVPEIIIPDKESFESAPTGRFHCNAPNCDESFSSKNGLTGHHWQIHISTNFACQFCGFKTFPTEKDFKSHVDNYHIKEEPLKCKKCKKTSKDKQALWRHIRESHRPKKFPCLVCGFQFSRPENLKVHMKGHETETTPPVWTCKECGKTFKAKSAMRGHIQISHRDDGVRHKCQICSKEFRHAKVLRRHLVNHKLERKFECSPCQSKFKTRTKLQRHFETSLHKYNFINLNTPPTIKTELQPEGEQTVETRMVRVDHIQNSTRPVKLSKKRRGKKSSPISEDEDDSMSNLLHMTRIQTMEAQLGPERRSKRLAMVKIASLLTTEATDEPGLPMAGDRPKSRKSTRKMNPEVGEEESPCADYPDSNSVKVTIKDEIEVEEPFVYIPKEEPVMEEDEEDSCNWEDLQTSITSLTSKGYLTDEVIETEVELPEDNDGAGRTKENKYFCMYCDKDFVSVSLVQEHEVRCGEFRRSRKRPICSDCGKSFFNHHKLKLHKVSHVTDRAFRCDLCPTTFKRHATLKNHQDVVHKGKMSYWKKTRPNIQPVPCNICSKIISTPKNLRVHIKEVHGSGDKFRFKCQLCPQKFRRTDGLRDHIKFDHEEQSRFECKICEATFDREFKLAKHLTRKRHLEKVALDAKGKLQKKAKLRRWNVVLQNVPESKAGLEMAANIMKILLPDLEVKIQDRRIGPKTKSLKRNPRSLRIFLPSVYYRNIALANSSLLKNDKTFSKISISKDLMKFSLD